MKVLVAVFALCVVGALGGLTDVQKAKLTRHKKLCIAESGVDPVAVENAKKGEIASEDPKLQCFGTCILREIGILDAEGVFHENVVRAAIPADIPVEKVDAVINRCKSLVGSGSNLCQSGAAVFTCALKHKLVSLL